jgi:hypothetical protein
MKKPLLTLVLLLVISGCTIMKTSNVLVGEKKTPVSPTLVKLYTTPPSKYVEIALLSVDAGHDFKPDQIVMDEAVEKLKEEAGALGANGVIITSIGEKGTGSSVGMGVGTATSKGNMVTGNSMMVVTGQRFKNISGTAIFVNP